MALTGISTMNLLRAEKHNHLTITEALSATQHEVLGMIREGIAKNPKSFVMNIQLAVFPLMMEHLLDLVNKTTAKIEYVKGPAFTRYVKVDRGSDTSPVLQ